ncbi:MAG: hypothetical protein HMLKMBBP_03963 [Planctomycetes bacterium]|nr:hypothetical protein [Planctomycetota bacterium]
MTDSRARFATTQWTVVLAARGTGDEARGALASLCAAYWPPLYSFARRKGASPDDAADLVQEFFAGIVERAWTDAADPARGRFRTFLLTAFVRHMSKDREARGAWKRGGRTSIVTLDAPAAEHRYLAEPADLRTPEDAFERRWALTVLATVHDRVRAAFVAASNDPDPARVFDALAPHIAGPGDVLPHAETAAALGLTADAVKLRVHRLRALWRATLREAVRDTVDGDEDVDAEIRGLISALSRSS